MKCTECNKTVKPVVALDIDGTMGMYHKHFLEFASGYLNQQVKDHYVGNQPFKEWFVANYRCTADDWHDIKLAYRQGGMKRTMPVYPDAHELSKLVQSAGAELWVTTTRPYIRHDNIDPDTREWLRRHHIKYDYMIYDGHKYHKLRQLVGAQRVCAVLDDLPEEIWEAERMFGYSVPIWRRQSFNRGSQINSIMQVTNLPMAGRIIKDRIRIWKERYDGGADPRTHTGAGTGPVQRDGEPDPAGAGETLQDEVS